MRRLQDHEYKNELQLNVIKKDVKTVIEKLIFYLDLPMENQNLKDTPRRVASMYAEMFKGCYVKEPDFTVFDNEKKVSSMILVKSIDFNSMCSHHFLPFIGKMTIGYIPDKKIVGLSKIPRVVDWFGHRPQIQEDLTEQIASYLYDKLNPLGLGVYAEASHSCSQIRGVKKKNSLMITTALRGIFLKENGVKNEFLGYIQ